MSVSLYYTAHRAEPLTASERETITALVREAIVDEEARRHGQGKRRPSGESFCVYDPTDPSEPTIVFEGATKLPGHGAGAMWTALQHWAALLSRIRRAVPRAVWHVSVDDHDLVWDEVAQAYDPTQ
jgi:hypothetical protein